MRKFKKINVRWNRDDSPDYESMGIAPPEDDFHKEILIDINSIVAIENYKGVCCVYFSGSREDCMITDVPYNEEKIKEIFEI